MQRFGDFTVLENLGRSQVADRFKAMHDTLGGPFFVKRYSRLPTTLYGELHERCERLMGLSTPNLAPHLGHGDVDGVPFAVSPYLEGVDLDDLIRSLKERRITLKLEALLLIARELALAVDGLARVGPGAAPFAHGDVSAIHVRLGPKGQLWLTGLPTPRILVPDVSPEPVWDTAGVAAAIYDLMPLTRYSPQRPQLPTLLDAVVRRSLGIGPATEQLSPRELAERLEEVREGLKLGVVEASALADIAARTMQAVAKKRAEEGHAMAALAADALPTLEPVFEDAPTLDPLPLEPPPARAAPRPAAPAPLPASPPSPAPVLPAASEAPAPTASSTSIPLAAPPAPAAVEARRSPAPLAAPTHAERRADDVGDHTVEAPRASRERTTVPDNEATVSLPDDPMGEPTAPHELASELPFDLPPDVDLLDDEPTRPTVQALGWQTTSGPSSGSAEAPAPPSPPPPIAPRAPPPKAPSARGAPRLVDDPESSRPAPVAPARSVPRDVTVIARAPPELSASLLADPASSAEGTPEDSGPKPAVKAASPSGSERAIQALLKRGIVTPEQVARARAAQQQRGGRLVEILVASGASTDTAVADALAEEALKPRISDRGLLERLPSPSICRRLPQTYVLARRVLPLSLGDGALVLAVADPFALDVIDEVRALLGARSAQIHVAARGALTEATVKAYQALGLSLTPGKSSGPTVLLCMEDGDLAGTVGARFVEEGFRVEHADTTDRAMVLLDVRPPDAVVAAGDMTTTEGQRLLLYARGLEQHADTPIFVVGPQADDATLARILDLGADDYFPRPVNLDVVVAKLRRALGKRGSASQSSPSIPVQAEPPPPPPPEPFSPFDMPSIDDLPDLLPAPDDLPEEEAVALPTGVMGTLRQMAVSEIVQSLELGRKTAKVELHPADGPKGLIAFEDGQVVYAECEELRGEEAFYALARHEEGFFRIRYGDRPTERNIDAPTTFLLLEAMRRMDEEDNPGGEGGGSGGGPSFEGPTPFD